MQVLGLLGKYLSVRREVFPHMLHVKLASVSLRAGSFFVPAMYGFERKGRGATESPHVHWLKIRPGRWWTLFQNCPFALWFFPKRELHVSVLSFVYISDIDRSGRIILPNLVIYAQHSSLGERRLLLNCELPYKQGRFLHTEADPQSLCLACAQLTQGAFGPMSSLMWRLWHDRGPSCFPELPSGSALVTSPRLRAGHDPP